MDGYVRCWTCNGNGVVNIVRPGPDPWDTAKCPDCKGTGKDDKKTEALKKGE